jgi:hypothetical protein
VRRCGHSRAVGDSHRLFAVIAAMRVRRVPIDGNSRAAGRGPELCRYTARSTVVKLRPIEYMLRCEFNATLIIAGFLVRASGTCRTGSPGEYAHSSGVMMFNYAHTSD